MEIKDWHSRWESGNTGWHQPGGSSALRKFWPGLHPGGRVLVPLCGKSPDLLWLAKQGYDVTGVELS
ncbi:MAG: thiopurine S-methyltransferase, partial [Lysobacterales bacterium]